MPLGFSGRADARAVWPSSNGPPAAPAAPPPPPQHRLPPPPARWRQTNVLGGNQHNTRSVLHARQARPPAHLFQREILLVVTLQHVGRSLWTGGRGRGRVGVCGGWGGVWGVRGRSQGFRLGCLPAGAVRCAAAKLSHRTQSLVACCHPAASSSSGDGPAVPAAAASPAPPPHLVVGPNGGGLPAAVVARGVTLVQLVAALLVPATHARERERRKDARQGV